MQSSIRFSFGLIAILGFAYLAQAHPLSSREATKSAESTEVTIPGSHETPETKEVALPEEGQTTAIDTLGESNGRVKRQGGCGCCGCGCGCCCCRPRCCCCCRRCCTCCRTCCCTRCCTCCRPCCCGCGCGCGCGCCGCGGGGRKRRSLQTLKIKLADKLQREARQIEQIPEEVAPVETSENIETPETAEEKKPEEVETATEWPEPVYELVTETWAH